MDALALEGVTVGYGRAPVLRDVSLSVARGERVALLGPNGAGKTTLLRAAGGSLRPDAGRVLVEGKDLAGMSAREAARRISGVAQQEGSEFAFTVREVVALGRVARLRPWSGPSPEDDA